MSWLRLWIMGGCEACGTALRLSNCINEPVSGLGSLLYIFCSNSESGETNISGTNKTDRSTRTKRGRPVFDVNTKFAAEFTFCCVQKPNKRTYEEQESIAFSSSFFVKHYCAKTKTSNLSSLELNRTRRYKIVQNKDS